MLHLPPPGQARTGGVVICPPLGRDNVFAHRALHVLARGLAAAGVSTLHFDWPGVGDSEGTPADAGIASSWIASVGVAAGFLGRVTGVDLVTLVGVRVGAMLALAATSQDDLAVDLVLWAPDVSGRGYLREVAAFEAVSGTSGAFPLGLDARQALGAIDVRELRLPSLDRRRALVVGRDGAPADEEVARQLEEAGAAVDRLESQELDWILNDITKLPGKAIAATVDWVAKPTPMLDPAVTSHSSRILVAGPSDPVLEETVILSTPRGDVVAVTSRPQNLDPAAPWIAFPSTAQMRRMGPSRLWTTLARRWAATGIPSIRFDVHGVGDSDGPEMASPDLRTQYSTAVVETAAAALAYARTRHGASAFTLVGLCSGGTTAIELARVERDIHGLVLINVQLFSVDDTRLLSIQRSSALTALRSREAWAALVRGRGARKVVPAGIRIARALISQGERRTRPKGASSSSALPALLDTLQERDIPTLFVYSDPDPGLEIVHALPGGLDIIRGRPNVDVALVPDAGHTFTAVGACSALCTLLEEHISVGRLNLTALSAA